MHFACQSSSLDNNNREKLSDFLSASLHCLNGQPPFCCDLAFIMLAIRQTKAYNFLLAHVPYLCMQVHNYENSALRLESALCQPKWPKQWLYTTTKEEI